LSISPDGSPDFAMIEANPGMPKLGLGTYQMQGAGCQAAVESALALGYRHIDTGQMYGNEAAIGAGIVASGVPRAEIFLTGKVCHALVAPAEARVSLDITLQRLQTDYLDLCLLHWPRVGLDIPATLEMLMQAQDSGKTRRIGVANFTLPLLQLAVTEVGAPLFCNQVEYHVLLDQSSVLKWLRERDMMLVAHVPLARGQLVDHPALAGIGARHGATASQVALKWLLDQDGVAAIPKAGRTVSQRGNLGALDLQLDEADRDVIAGLPKNVRVVDPPFAPKWDR
jgi:2,5-diketo-D-gluconate reductase B